MSKQTRVLKIHELHNQSVGSRKRIWKPRGNTNDGTIGQERVRDACVPLPRWREDRFLGRKPREPCLGCSNLRWDILASCSSSLPAGSHNKTHQIRRELSMGGSPPRRRNGHRQRGRGVESSREEITPAANSLRSPVGGRRRRGKGRVGVSEKPGAGKP
jgi:hypothetical protein